MVKWIGAAAWSAKEARVGDRLPYARLIDESTVLLRDGSVMSSIQVPGLLFETEDSAALNAHAATREVMLRSALDSRPPIRCSSGTRSPAHSRCSRSRCSLASWRWGDRRSPFAFTPSRRWSILQHSSG